MAESLIGKEDRSLIARYLNERVAGPVALETWTRKESGLILTDRDPCEFCDDVVDAARTLATLHSALSITLYDMDKHAARAEEAGIERPPLTVARGRNGRELRVLGLWSGLLFPAMLDAIAFLSAGMALLGEESAGRMASLEDDVTVEVMGAPYDQYSAHMLRILAAIATASPRVRVQFSEMSEFPILATARGLSEVPVTAINGRRYSGVWEADQLAEQIVRVAEGNNEPVIRDHVLTNPYLTKEQALQMATEQAGGQAAMPPGGPSGGAGDQPGPGGLIVPGR